MSMGRNPLEPYFIRGERDPNAYQYKKLASFKVSGSCPCGGDELYGYKNSYLAKCYDCKKERHIRKIEYNNRRLQQ